jgi:hypothetical protein
VLVVGAVGVEEFHVSGTDDLEAVLKVGSGSQIFGSEAGAGVVDFEELDGLGGAVADSCGDVGGVAACRGDETKDEGWDEAHEYLGYQGGSYERRNPGRSPKYTWMFFVGRSKNGVDNYS